MAKRTTKNKIDPGGDVLSPKIAITESAGPPVPIDPYDGHPARIEALEKRTEALEKQVEELKALVADLAKKVSHLGAQTPTGGTIPLSILQVAACIEADGDAKFMVLAAWDWNGYREARNAILLARESRDLPRFVNKGLKLSLVASE